MKKKKKKTISIHTKLLNHFSFQSRWGFFFIIIIIIVCFKLPHRCDRLLLLTIWKMMVQIDRKKNNNNNSNSNEKNLLIEWQRFNILRSEAIDVKFHHNRLYFYSAVLNCRVVRIHFMWQSSIAVCINNVRYGILSTNEKKLKHKDTQCVQTIGKYIQWW